MLLPEAAVKRIAAIARPTLTTQRPGPPKQHRREWTGRVVCNLKNFYPVQSAGPCCSLNHRNQLGVEEFFRTPFVRLPPMPLLCLIPLKGDAPRPGASRYADNSSYWRLSTSEHCSREASRV